MGDTPRRRALRALEAQLGRSERQDPLSREVGEVDMSASGAPTAPKNRAMEPSVGGTPMPRLRIAQAVLTLAAAVALSIGAAQPSFAGDADLACKRCGG